MTMPIFPNVQSIGNGGKTKNEAKANAIIAFLAHLEKRKQVGLFVPYVVKTDLSSKLSSSCNWDVLESSRIMFGSNEHELRRDQRFNLKLMDSSSNWCYKLVAAVQERGKCNLSNIVHRSNFRQYPMVAFDTLNHPCTLRTDAVSLDPKLVP